MKYKTLEFLILPTMSLVLASCTKDLTPYATGRSIGCIVSEGRTRSDADGSDAMISQRSIKSDSGLCLSECVYENTASFAGNATRAAEITTEGNDGSISIRTEGFVMNAYAEKDWHNNETNEGFTPGLYFGPSAVTYSGQWQIEDSPTWINAVPMTFWCWDAYNDSQIASTASYTAGQSPRGSLTFTYALPTPATSAPYDDAFNQHDLVISCNVETRSFKGNSVDSGSSSGSRTDDKMNIKFYHALSAVQFFTGNVPAGHRISRIALKNVASSSMVTVTGTTPLSFNYANSGTATYTQDYSDGDSSLVPAEGDKSHKPGDTKTFFMIPQTLGENAQLEVTVVSTSDPTDISVNTFPLAGGSWQAGLYYVYRLNAAGEVGVDIYENFPGASNPKAKENVKFLNTNNVSEYFRAAIVGYWYDSSDHSIVAPWTTAQGSFSGIGLGWTQGSDGFFYYNAPVPAGEYSNPLFASYAPPTTGTPSTSNTSLEVAILVQAVAYKEGVSCMDAFQ